MYIGNNAMEQLSVISRDPADITLLDLIDKTSTAFGKRLLKERLLNPICDKALLEKRYDLTELLLPISTVLKRTSSRSMTLNVSLDVSNCANSTL